MVWTILVFSLGTAALGLTHDFWQFAVFRFIASLGLGAQYVVCNTLMAEYVPTARRTTVLGTLQAGWSVGYVVATLLAGWILPSFGWRWLFFLAIVPVVLAVLMQRYIPEPASYLAARAGAISRGAAATPGRARCSASSAIRRIAACSCCGRSRRACCSSATTASTTGCRPTSRRNCT